MIVVLEQLAGLGIRDKFVRMAAWISTSGLAAVSTFAISVAAGLITYLTLFGFALWRLLGPR